MFYRCLPQCQHGLAQWAAGVKRGVTARYVSECTGRPLNAHPFERRECAVDWATGAVLAFETKLAHVPNTTVHVATAAADDDRGSDDDDTATTSSSSSSSSHRSHHAQLHDTYVEDNFASDALVAWDRSGGANIAVKEIDLLDFLSPSELLMREQSSWTVDTGEQCSGGATVNATSFVGLTSVAVAHGTTTNGSSSDDASAASSSSSSGLTTYLLASADMNALFLFTKNATSGSRELTWALSPDVELRHRLDKPGKYIGFNSDADAFYAP